MVASGYVMLWNILLQFHKDVFLLAARSTIDILYIFQLLTVIRKRQGDYMQTYIYTWWEYCLSMRERASI